MRLLLLADVHANWEALLSLQRAEAKPDAVLFAGDAVGYGPDPAQCVRWLTANATLAVRGNHDEALARPDIDGFPTELAEAARETVAYARRSLSAADQAGLARWPLTASATMGGARFFLVHGTPPEPLAGPLDPATCSEAELERLFADVPADVIVVGHTHLPALRRFQDKLIINPGSLGQPRYGAPDATFAVWHDGQVQIHHLHYDHDAPARKLPLLGLSPETTEKLAEVLETGLL
jgi:putative phosphoesterase